MMYRAESAVVFFSRDGNTRRGAEILCDRLGGRLIELKERKKSDALQAMFRMRSMLDGDPWSQIAPAKRVFLMTPIWAGSSVPAMNAFASKADFTDKDVYILSFQQSANHRLSHKVHQHIAGIVARNHGSVRECYALVGGKVGKFAGEEAIRAEIDKVKMPEETETPTPAAEAEVASETEKAATAEAVPMGPKIEAEAVPETEKAATAEAAAEKAPMEPETAVEAGLESETARETLPML